MRKFSQVLLFVLLPAFVFAQNTISGTVTDATTGDALPGANVVVEGTNMGAAATADGSYSINNVPSGSYTVTASVIGYANGSQSVNVSGNTTVNFALDVSALELSALEVLASRADEKTPVAYTNISKQEIEARLGSQEIPMVLNTTPSVYATQQGGGAGDARINVRGFNQRNVAVMINGVPQNDMENGWVYWSNWDGVGDATSSIQMQRGLSAVNLATPSIGGTMNIITDPTAMSRGGKFKQEFGDGGFLKTTANLNTGLIMDDKLPLVQRSSVKPVMASLMQLGPMHGPIILAPAMRQVKKAVLSFMPLVLRSVMDTICISKMLVSMIRNLRRKWTGMRPVQFGMGKAILIQKVNLPNLKPLRATQAIHVYLTKTGPL